MSKIGKNIKKLRLRTGLSQEALAKKAGLTRGGLAKIEGGQRKTPDWVTYRKLAKALGVPITFNLEGKMDAKKWNKEVEEKVKLLESALPWLKAIEDDEKEAWDDRANAGRARHKIEMAILDIYSLQFFDKGSAQRWRESLEVEA